VARDAVQRAYDWFGQEYGFVRRSGDLFKESDQVIAALDLQRSEYAHSYYINVGFALRELHSASVAKFGLCDIRIRADALIGKAERLGQLLDLTNGLDATEREFELRRVLREELLPILESGLTLEGLRCLWRNKRLRGFVHKDARAVLTDDLSGAGQG
jgi:hypothetical protein